MRNYNENYVARHIAQLLAEQVLEEHERASQRGAEFMGDCHLIVYYRLVAIFLLQHFTFKFERLDVISHVVEIDSCGFLLQKLYAFHTYLGKLILRE